MTCRDQDLFATHLQMVDGRGLVGEALLSGRRQTTPVFRNKQRTAKKRPGDDVK